MISDTESDGTFELEPEDERPVPKPDVSVGRAPPMPGPPVPAHDPDAPEEPGAKTVAERTGEAVPTTPGALPPPPDWPREALTFPIRNPGPSFFAGVGGAFVVVDVISGVEQLAFVSYVLWVLLWVCVLRAQAAVIGQSAAGKDHPVGWRSALELDFGGLSTTARFLVVYCAAYGLPLWLALVFSLDGAALVAALLSPYLAVVMLGWATGDRTLKWPWKALEWLARRPLEFVVGGLGWWALWFGHVLVIRTPLPALIFVSLLVRGASLYLLLVSARAIGVAGRSWTPWGYQDPA